MKKLLVVTLALFAMQAQAGEAEIRKAADGLLGGRAKVEAVRKSAVPGMYEVMLESKEFFYMDESGKYAFMGDMYDVKNKRNISEDRRNKLAQVNFSELPLNLAIKQVKGNGKRVFATFEDPNCGYCKKLAKEIQNMNDVTVYTFMLPILSPDSQEKADNIMCAADPAKAWNDWMINAVTPPAAKCDSPVAKSAELGQKLNVRGTPAIVLSDGSRIPGYLPAVELEKRLAAVGK